MVNNGARSSSQASQPDSNVNGVASRDNSVKPQKPPPPTSASTSKPRQRAPPTTADIVAASVGAKKERKRQRVHYSCAECHRRKHKCDRQIPCQPCVERGLGETCRPFQTGDQYGDVRDRVSRLEELVEGLAKAQANMAQEICDGRHSGPGQLANVSSISNWNSSSQRDPRNLDQEDDENGGARKKQRREDNSFLGMEREELISAENRAGREASGLTGAITRISRGNEGPSLEGGLSREGDSWYGALALPSVSRGVIETEIRGEKLELSANFPRWPASVKLHRLIHEGGASATILTDLMASLPSRVESDSLLNLYFRDINHTRLPLHEGTFRASYDELMAFRWGNAREEQGDDGARHLPFLAFLFIILATAKRSQPEDEVTEREAKRGAMELYHSCRKTIAVATFIRVDHIDLVLAHLFAARFLTVNRQSAEAWSMLGFAIRAAQAIGLHRDGSQLNLDAVTTERRRRLWALLVYLDATTSILLGRPTGIQSSHTDTLPPSDLDIDTLPRTSALPPKKAKPGQPPGVFNFLAIRHDLTKITGKVVEHFQNLSIERKYSDVLTLDSELQAFHAALPPPYRTELEEGYDRSFDKKCPWLTIHRYLINIEYHYIRIALHRPYVLRNALKYSQSRTAAFASARADRSIRQEYYKDVGWPSNRARKAHMGGLYRLFNSCLMIGIALLLDPNSKESADLITYLDEFIEKHKNAETIDQCSKREVKIIELFRTKARDPTWCAATATGANNGTSDAAGGNGSGSGGVLPSIARVLGASTGSAPGEHSSAGEGLATGSEAASGNGLPGLDPVSGSQMWSNSNNRSENQDPNSNQAPSDLSSMNNPPSFSSMAQGSSSSDGITPPSNWANFSGGLDNNPDLAQNIFDQLGLFDQFGMMSSGSSGQVLVPDTTTGGGGVGANSNLNSFDLFGKNNGFDMTSPGLWDYNQSPIDNVDLDPTSINGNQQNQSGIQNSSISKNEGVGPSRLSFSSTQNQQNSQEADGNEEPPFYTFGSSSNPTSSIDANANATANPSNSVDASMLPWGGLIEAISQVAPAQTTETEKTAEVESEVSIPAKKGKAKGKGKAKETTEAEESTSTVGVAKGRKSRKS